MLAFQTLTVLAATTMAATAMAMHRGCFTASGLSSMIPSSAQSVKGITATCNADTVHCVRSDWQVHSCVAAGKPDAQRAHRVSQPRAAGAALAIHRRHPHTFWQRNRPLAVGVPCALCAPTPGQIPQRKLALAGT